ncbi:MAG: efflux RND transporter periplasmic adaptor subunit [Verrucomicrobia bacterium]|nr:efflux RND transporter periplasmic adaptor subunit [Verrucomicrobiota bacterium]
MILAVILVFAVVVGIYVSKVMKQIALAKSGAFDPPPAAVTTVKLTSETWPRVLKGVGTMEAVNGVTVAADLPGVVQKIEFESGTPAKKGDVLVRLFTDQEEAQVKAAEAKRDLDQLSLNRQRELLKSKTASQSDYDTADATYRQSEANVQQMKAMVARKTISAPFAGTLGIRKVNLGQYLNSGDAIVDLQSLNPIRVNFSLPQQELTQVAVGSDVRLRTDATGSTEFAGKVTALNSMIDVSTRNVLIQATLPNPEGKLRPGMFANVEVLLAENDQVLPVPASAILYAPYGDSVFVVKQVKDPKHEGKMFLGVEQHFVKLGPTRGDLIAILSGVEPGDEVVSSGVFKLQNSAPVKVNNSVQPGANPAPTPENS